MDLDGWKEKSNKKVQVLIEKVSCICGRKPQITFNNGILFGVHCSCGKIMTGISDVDILIAKWSDQILRRE